MYIYIKWKPLLISVAIAEIMGAISGFLSMAGMEKFTELQKPIYAPSGDVFVVVWIILYLLMGIAAYLVYTSNSKMKGTALFFYTLQLIVNFFWSIIFFRFEMRLLAFWWIIFLIILVIITTYLFYKIDIRAGLLMLPYLIWICFALFLNYKIYKLNG